MIPTEKELGAMEIEFQRLAHSLSTKDGWSGEVGLTLVTAVRSLQSQLAALRTILTAATGRLPPPGKDRTMSPCNCPRMVTDGSCAIHNPFMAQRIIGKAPVRDYSPLSPPTADEERTYTRSEVLELIRRAHLGWGRCEGPAALLDAFEKEGK